MVARVFAFLAGALVLVIGSVFSLGAVLVAPIGMAIGAYVWRKRGRSLPTIGHWLAAMAAIVVMLASVAGLAAAVAPKGSWDRFRHAADSAQKVSASQPPPPMPDWLQRMAPNAQQRAATAPPSDRAVTFMLAAGAAMATVFFVGFFGSVGWLGGMLLGLGVKGHWPGRGAATSS